MTYDARNCLYHADYCLFASDLGPQPQPGEGTGGEAAGGEEGKQGEGEAAGTRTTHKGCIGGILSVANPGDGQMQVRGREP